MRYSPPGSLSRPSKKITSDEAHLTNRTRETMEEPEPEPLNPEQTFSVDELMGSGKTAPQEPSGAASIEDVQLKAVLEAIIYVAEEPLTLAQVAASLQQ